MPFNLAFRAARIAKNWTRRQGGEGHTYCPLIKSSVEDLPEDDQQDH